MEISYAQLEDVLVRHFGIHPERRRTFRSRIGQLQYLNFPLKKGVGKGANRTYRAEHLFKLVVAFELIGASVPAKSAIDLTLKHWQELAVSFALAIKSANRFPRGPRIYAWIISRSFGHLQISLHEAALPSVTNASRMIVADEASFIDVFTRKQARSAHLYPTFCISDLAQSVISNAEAAGVPRPANDVEIMDWIPAQWSGMIGNWLYVDDMRLLERPSLTGQDLLGMGRSPEERAALEAEAGMEAAADALNAAARLNAFDLVHQLRPGVLTALLAEEDGEGGDLLALDDADLKQMMFLGLVTVGEEVFEITDYGRIVSEVARERAGAIEALGGGALVRLNLLRDLRAAAGRAKDKGPAAKRFEEVIEASGLAPFIELDPTPPRPLEGERRPDAVVYLPEGRTVLITEGHFGALGDGAETMRLWITRRIGRASYRRQWGNSVDYVIMYLSNEEWLSQALMEDPEILEWALKRRVLIATPEMMAVTAAAIIREWEAAGQTAKPARAESK